MYKESKQKISKVQPAEVTNSASTANKAATMNVTTDNEWKTVSYKRPRSSESPQETDTSKKTKM